MMSHHNFIKHYENMIPGRICDWLISSFEDADQLVFRRNGPQNFDELNINKTFPEILFSLVGCVQHAAQQYRNDVPEASYFPELALEEFRVKRYRANTGQQFSDHVDVGSLSSSKRYLSFLYYLNDDFLGGETQFFPDLRIKPVRGSVVVFPPTWMFPHAGLPVDVGTKYIMSSYLNYE